MPGSAKGLVRAIGRWSLVALTINSILGSGIFGLPSVIAKFAGSRSPLAVLLAGAAMGVIVTCFAEVASQFSEAGGPYLYARSSLGRLAGIETGWMLWMSQATAVGANANLFVIYLGRFFPWVTAGAPRLAALTALVGILAAVNYRGVKSATGLSNVFAVAKLVPLAIVLAGGTAYLAARHLWVPAGGAAAEQGGWLKAMLLLIFIYGGFETALAPMSEAKDPRRDTVFALYVSLAVCTVLYTMMQWIVVTALPDAAHSPRPVAEVAQLFAGDTAAGLIAGTVLLSLFGYLSAKMLAMPRITFAMGENGDFPALFAAIHPQHRTPYISVLAMAAVSWAMALEGGFTSNAMLSAVGRLFYYAASCAALLALRRRQADATPHFRVPGGKAFAVTGIAICAVLAGGVDRSGGTVVLLTATAGLVNWWMVRSRDAAAAVAHSEESSRTTIG